MFDFIANIFGYLLNFLYNLFNNYGLAIIIFSILLKLILLPLTIKQQKTMEKTSKMQDELKSLQFKYKNDPEKLNKEMMDMYKRENMSPFSGCLSSIVQLILILAVFYLVRSPLTYMKKVDINIINDYKNQLETKTNYPEVQVIKEFGNENEAIYVNMEFLGLDLSSIPTADAKDFRAFIIPGLYVISSIIFAETGTAVQEELVQPLFFASSSIINIVYFGSSAGNIDKKKVLIFWLSYFPFISLYEVPVFPPTFIFLRFAIYPVPFVITSCINFFIIEEVFELTTW